jgi:hypothetical protein
VPATRFSPGSGGAPAALAEFCQLARRGPDPKALAVDTLATPRSRRSLVALVDEAAADGALRCIVRDAEQWDTLRSRVFSRSPELGGRRVDFGREMLVVAAMGGPQPMFSGIWVDGSWSRGDTLIVAVNDGGDDSGGTGVGARDASPAVVVAVPRVSGPVFFLERTFPPGATPP